MQEKSAGTIERSWLSDGALIALLLLLAAGLHAWLVAHTVVAARDSIGYIRYALWMDEQPMGEVLRHMDQHPGYPFAVMLVSKPVRAFMGGTTVEAMVLSAQLASAVAGTLLVVPMFYLGRLLFDRRAGFWAAVMFQTLPVSAHVLGDAVSESVYFLFLASCLLFAAQGLRDRSILRLALCGFFGGLAYLTRPEGAIAVAATLLVLVGMQTVRTVRWPWRQALAATAAVLLAALAVGGPYCATIGSLTAKPTGDHILHMGDKHEVRRTPDQHTLLASSKSLFAVYLYPDPYAPHEVLVWRGFWAVLQMTSRACQYVLWIPAVIGLFYYHDRLRSTPGAWVVLLLCALHGLVLWRMVAKVGYVSERHALTLLFGCSFWAAAMLTNWADGLATWRIPERWQAKVAFCLLVAATCFALPSTLQPLHANRLGHKQAGLFLANHVGPEDKVLDPYCWAHFYAGQVFTESLPKPKDAPVVWVVMEESDNPHERLFIPSWIKDFTKTGSAEFEWTPRQKDRKYRAEKVVVYRFPPLPKASLAVSR